MTPVAVDIRNVALSFGSARVVVDHAHARGEPTLVAGTPVTLSVPADEIRFIAA